jgi:hypothetical protein
MKYFLGPLCADLAQLKDCSVAESTTGSSGTVQVARGIENQAIIRGAAAEGEQPASDQFRLLQTGSMDVFGDHEQDRPTSQIPKRRFGHVKSKI